MSRLNSLSRYIDNDDVFHLEIILRLKPIMRKSGFLHNVHRAAIKHFNRLLFIIRPLFRGTAVL